MDWSVLSSLAERHGVTLLVQRHYVHEWLLMPRPPDFEWVSLPRWARRVYYAARPLRLALKHGGAHERCLGPTWTVASRRAAVELANVRVLVEARD